MCIRDRIILGLKIYENKKTKPVPNIVTLLKSRRNCIMFRDYLQNCLGFGLEILTIWFATKENRHFYICSASFLLSLFDLLLIPTIIMFMSVCCKGFRIFLKYDGFRI
eukprot:TRINITY_DN7570_c0_g1_i1.p1 TRINITY_DN7570_c0_g1~~TRINITY_DN7570_c0_g1_i1.p1  ORF type:complete len:108 (-),score=12.67 TRINITY_DN7570_c0_g1_i1:98-421(-)